MCRRRLPVRDWRYAADSIFLAHTKQLYTALDKFQVSVKTSPSDDLRLGHAKRLIFMKVFLILLWLRSKY
jgi:hypothetical protein